MTRAVMPKDVAPHPSVQEFLDGFARSLTAGDGEAIGRMWAVPAYVLGDTMAMPVTTVKEVEDFFAGAKDQYNKRGISDTRAVIKREIWLTDRIVAVDVRWPYIDANGAEKGEESSTYVLQVDDIGALKIRTTIMHGASETM